MDRNMFSGSGVAAQVEEGIRLLARAHDELVTKRDLQIVLAPLKWGVAITVGGMIALMFKSFFTY
ncbi:MAG: hypothetical protein H7829_01990 [Magnetococcus sp. THC-1_WYH]